MTTFPPFHLPFLFYHSHSTSLPFLSLFLALSSSSSPFSYKQQPHSSLQTHPNGEGQTLLFLFSIIFSILQYLGFSRLQGGEEGDVTITTSHQPHMFITITTLGISALDCLLSRIQRSVVFEFFMFSIWCNSTLFFKFSIEFLFVA